MNLRIAICDDSPNDRKILFNYLNQYFFEHSYSNVIDTFTSSKQFLQAHKNLPYQIIFSDIEMPEMDGMTLAQNIRELDNYNPFIIFTTFYPKYMQDSFDVQPFQYLTKPLSFDAIKSVIDKIIKKLDKNSLITAITDENGETHFVCLKDIIYISSLKLRKQYVQYHLVQEDILCRDTISNLEVLLSDKGFVSSTRGLLVNVRHIKSFDATTIKLKNSETVPVSRRRIKIIQETYVKHIIELIN